MSEDWKVVEEFPKYSISREGQVRNDKTNYILSQSILSGYLSITFNKTRKYIHRLLAEAFIPNPNNLPFVDHINRNRQDNRLENLRWVSVSENTLNTDKKSNYIYEIHVKGWGGKMYTYFRVERKINCKTYVTCFKSREEAEAFTADFPNKKL